MTPMIVTAQNGAPLCRLPLCHRAFSAFQYYGHTCISEAWKPYQRDEWDILTERWAQAHADNTVMGWRAVAQFLVTMMRPDKQPAYLVGMFEVHAVAQRHEEDAARSWNDDMMRIEREGVAA